MAPTRRNAVRLTMEEPAALCFLGRSLPCTLLDLSATGAKVRLSEPRPIPDRVTLEVQFDGAPLPIRGQVRRGEAGAVIAIEFEHEPRTLAQLIAEEQRHAIAEGRAPSVERRREPR